MWCANERNADLYCKWTPKAHQRTYGVEQSMGRYRKRITSVCYRENDIYKWHLPFKSLPNGLYSWSEIPVHHVLTPRGNHQASNKTRKPSTGSLSRLLAEERHRLHASVLSNDTSKHTPDASYTFILQRETALLRRNCFFFHPCLMTQDLLGFNMEDDILWINNTLSSACGSTPLAPRDVFYATCVPGFAKTDANQYRLWGRALRPKDHIQVAFRGSLSSKSVLHVEDVSFLDMESLYEAFTSACTLLPATFQGKFPHLTTLQLAEHTPMIFWNLVLHLDSDYFQIKQFLSQFTSSGIYARSLRFRHPALHNSRKKRRRLRGEQKMPVPCANPDSTLPPSPQHVKENRGSRRQAAFMSSASEAVPAHRNDCLSDVPDALRMAPVHGTEPTTVELRTEGSDNQKTHVFWQVKQAVIKRLALWNRFTQSRTESLEQPHAPCASPSTSAPTRSLYTKHTHDLRKRRYNLVSNDPLSLLNYYFDSSGFPLHPLHNVPLSQRRILYTFCCINGWTAPLDVCLNEKGRAVYAAHPIEKEDFICEYAGELLHQKSEAQRLELHYESQGLGCYMFYFKNPFNGKTNCIDATKENPEYGLARFINHSHIRPNCYAMVVPDFIRDKRLSHMKPRLAFIAKKSIDSNEELLIDYGERNAKIVKMNPWLINS